MTNELLFPAVTTDAIVLAQTGGKPRCNLLEYVAPVSCPRV
jgi:hypothetical protein